MDIYTKELFVNFSDVGENNKLTNRGFLRLMQEIAGMHSSLLGYGLNDTPQTGVAWIILNWKLKVFSRPKWGEKLNIKTSCKFERYLFSYRDLEIYDTNNTLIAIATSKWILFDINKQSLCKIPPKIADAFPNNYKPVFEEKFVEKLKEPKNSNFVYDYKIQRRDIDTNHHVNNLNYLDYAYEALPENIYRNIDFSNVEIMYKHSAKFGDIISVFYSCNDNEHYITIKSKDEKRIYAIIKLSY